MRMRYGDGARDVFVAAPKRPHRGSVILSGVSRAFGFARSAGTRSRRTSLRFSSRQHFQSKRGPSTTDLAGSTNRRPGSPICHAREKRGKGKDARSSAPFPRQGMMARGDALVAPASSRRIRASVAAQKNAAKMAALQELRGGWRTSSQAFVPGTIYRAPTTVTATAKMEGEGHSGDWSVPL